LAKTKFPDTYIIKFNPLTNAYHPQIRQVRGLIFNHATQEIYSLGFPVPIEFKEQAPTEQQWIIDHLHRASFKVIEALDGTLIRLWYHKPSQQWILSTNNKEDAHDAFWMNKVSFGDLFEATLARILSGLKMEYVYIFSLCHPLNVIVVNHDQPKIFHVATYNRTNQQEIRVNIGVEQPTELHLTVDQIILMTQSSRTMPVASAGFTVIENSNDGVNIHRYRFENVNYTRARLIRGETNRVEEIIMLYYLTQPLVLQEFLLYYPIYVPLYQQLIQKFNLLVEQVYNQYIFRFVQKKNIWVNKPIHTSQKTSHSPRRLQLPLQSITRSYPISNRIGGTVGSPLTPLNFLYIHHFVWEP
jgi:hypothetical protein